MASQLLTAAEVADELRVTERTVRRWSRAGLLEPVRLGGRLIRFTPESVDSLIRSAPETNEAPAGNGSLVKNADAGGGRGTG
jgi:excisionase family DNA binding protein